MVLVPKSIHQFEFHAALFDVCEAVVLGQEVFEVDAAGSEFVEMFFDDCVLFRGEHGCRLRRFKSDRRGGGRGCATRLKPRHVTFVVLFWGGGLCWL